MPKGPQQWTEADTIKATENVYHSIDAINDVINGWVPDRTILATDPENVEGAREYLESNLNFLKNTLKTPFYEGYLDVERVQTGIEAGEAYLNSLDSLEN